MLIKLFEFTDAVYSIPSSDIMLRSISIRSFTLHSIEVATHKYKILVGEGGFGCVYRGTLPDGQDVAVKVRSATSTQGTREFDNEVVIYISQHQFFHLQKATRIWKRF